MKLTPYQLRESLSRKKQDFLYWQTLHFASSSSLFGVTYANTKLTDGAGSQLQRIYGIYAISRLLKVAYIHSPLAKIDYQGLAALENNTYSQDIAAKYNQIFQIPSDIAVPLEHEIRYFDTVNLKSLLQLKQEAERRKTFILAQIMLPYGITDVYPDCYEAVKKVSPFSSSSSPTIRIAVHIRRGELFVVESHRMLPNDYYISVMNRIGSILEQLGLNYEFELYTEVPTKTFTVSTLDHFPGVEAPVVIDPKLNQLEDFDSVPNLKKFINTEPIDTFSSMASADVLIISHSSFSYLAALLNPKGIIFYHPFWHSPLKNWITTTNSGHFAEHQLIKQLKSLKDRST